MSLTRRSTIRASALFLGLGAVLVTMPLQGKPQGPKTERVRGHDAVAGEVLVKFRSALSGNVLSRFDRQMDADRRVRVGTRGAHRVHSKSFDTGALLSFLQVQPEVEYAEPNYILYATDSVPNDPAFPQLWGLQNPFTPVADIGAVKAWDVSKGSSSVVVAVVDTGVDYTHPDLAANIWSAPTPFTVTISGVNMPCPAGTHGFNAITNACDPKDDNNHGTHVSGTIGAIGNNGVGVVGVNWTTKIMGAKFLSASGSGSTADAVEAIEFVIQAKQIFGALANVRVLSNSWGGGGASQSLGDAITKANTNNMLFVAAAGNAAANNDTGPFYPANFTNENVLAVAATTNIDGLASFSNYGVTSVDLGAPGVGIVSTTRNNTYASYSGTSMATPHVAGTAALVLSVCNLSTAALKSNLMSTVTHVASLAGITVTGGRLNADAAIRACAGVGPSAPPPPTGLSAVAGNARVSLTWNSAAGATSYTVKRGLSPGSETTLVSGLTTRSHVDQAVANGTRYFYVVTALSSAGASGPSNEVSATPLAPPAAPSGLSAIRGNARVTLNWNAANGASSYTVKRGLSSGSETTIASRLTARSYVDQALANGTRYFYVVVAVNPAGSSGSSNEVSATPLAPPPVPTGLKATAQAGRKIDLKWNPVAGATSYRVRRATASGGPFTLIGTVTVTSGSNTNLTAGTTYYYVVSAVNAAGEGGNSAKVSAIAKK